MYFPLRPLLFAGFCALGLFSPSSAGAQGAGGAQGSAAKGLRTAPAPPLVPDVWNFSATKGNLEVDGFISEMWFFQRNNTRMAVMAPEGWLYAGNAGEMAFVNPKIPSARISIRKSSLPVPKEFDAAWSNSLKETLAGSLPRDSKNGKVTDLIPQPISTNGWKTFEGRCSFNQAGDRYVWSYVFIRLHELSMLEAIVVCRESDLPATRGALLSILPTWQSVGPKPGPAAPAGRATGR